jgi:hypothetical protein
LHGLDDIKVFREKQSIDILLVIDTTKQVIAIENKTGSKLHASTGFESNTGQLEKYKKYVCEDYKDYDRLFLYLDSNSNFNEDIGEWHFIDYTIVKNALEFCQHHDTIANKVKMIITDYLENIRRNIMNEIDKETQKLCDDIYKKYKVVIDFIYENKTNTRLQFGNVIKELLQAHETELGLVVNPEWSNATYIRFGIKGCQVSTAEDDGWVGQQHLLFEVNYNVKTNEANIYLVTHKPKIDETQAQLITKIREQLGKPKQSGEFIRHFQEKLNFNGDTENPSISEELLAELKSYINSKEIQTAIASIKAAF